MNSSNAVTDPIVIDHGWRGPFVRYVGWWILALFGLAAVGLLPVGLVSLARHGNLAWSSISPLLAWFGIGSTMVLAAYQAFRTRQAFSTVYLVDDAGIVIKWGDRLDQRVRWHELSKVRIEPMMTRMQLWAPTLPQPMFLVNGAASYARFRMLWTIIEERAGPVVTVVRPSKIARAAAIAVGLSVQPLAIDKLVSGELWGGALLMACGAFGVYVGITGMARLFRNPEAAGAPRLRSR